MQADLVRNKRMGASTSNLPSLATCGSILNSLLVTTDVKHLDRAVANLLRAKFSVGLFDKPAADVSKLKLLNTAVHRSVARQVVIEGATLLQNKNGTLPLQVNKSGGYHIAIVGPSAGCADNSTACDAIREQVRALLVLPSLACIVLEH